MTERKPLVIVDGQYQQLQAGDTLGGISAATVIGQAMIYDQFGANSSQMTPDGNPRFAGITVDGDGGFNLIQITQPATGAVLTIGEGATLSAPSNATVSGTNTGDQLTFKTIAVSGQSDVVADSVNDTLTLAAGSNVTITTNATTDTITIAASSGVSDGATLSTGLTFPNSGLKVKDADASHVLTISPGSNITANRTFTITTGDADRTLTLSANVTLNQSLQTTDVPIFAGQTLTTGAGSNPVLLIEDGDVSHSFTGFGSWGLTSGTTGIMSVASSTGGGMVLGGFTDNDGTAFVLEGHVNASSPTSSVILIRGYKTDGSTGRAAVTGDQYIAQIQAGTTKRFGYTGGGSFEICNGTAPTASIADTNQIYSADAAAGDSQLWARNEAGKVERLTGLRKRVSTQFDKTSDTTLANVTGLSFNVEAGKQYAFRAYLFTSSNASGGIKYAIAGTCTATSIRYDGITVGATGQITTSRATALATAVGALTTVSAAPAWIEGLIVVNAAGTLTVQFAQNASNASASSVLTGSYFELIPIGD